MKSSVERDCYRLVQMIVVERNPICQRPGCWDELLKLRVKVCRFRPADFREIRQGLRMMLKGANAK
jgi:hypothetical protein